MKRAAQLAIAFAATGITFAEEAAHGEHATPSIGSLAFPVVNFTIFALILWKYALPGLRSALVDRQKAVGRQLAEADAELGEARAALESIEELRARSREDGEKLVADFRAEAGAQSRAILAAARQMAERIRRDAELLFAQERERAAHTVRAEVANHVIARASELVRERFGEGEQRRAVAEFLAEVES